MSAVRKSMDTASSTSEKMCFVQIPLLGQKKDEVFQEK